MKVEAFDFSLPTELIAQTPLDCRDESRLLVVDRANGSLNDGSFRDILSYLHPQDVLVLNDTRVLPARLHGVNRRTGGAVEILLLRPYGEDCWDVMVKPGKRARVDAEIDFSEDLSCRVLGPSASGGRLVKFSHNGHFETVLHQVGETPLPPYIREEISDPERYQTVYSEYPGSAAAPTAGLHFTDELLGAIASRGTAVEFLTLHVGLATFRPVRSERVEDHIMHEEYYHISERTAQVINSRRRAGGRVVAVGTTSVRVLESVANDNGSVRPGSGWTKIFIYPGFEFKVTDALLTNFHLPKSSLLMLVSAFANRNLIFSAYEHAIAERYRFFSFGDAMLLI